MSERSTGVLRVEVRRAGKVYRCTDCDGEIPKGARHVVVTSSPGHEVGAHDGRWTVSRWCAEHGARLLSLPRNAPSVPNTLTREVPE